MIRISQYTHIMSIVIHIYILLDVRLGQIDLVMETRNFKYLEARLTQMLNCILYLQVKKIS